MMSEKGEEPSGNMEPSVYLDQNVLNSDSSIQVPENTHPEGRSYNVNGSYFNEHESDTNGDNMQFKLYASRINNISGDFFLPNDVDSQNVYCSTTESEDEDSPNETEELSFTIQYIPNGVIINSTVYLTEEQYNTIVKVDGYLLRCVACGEVTNTENCSDHMQRDSHKAVLEECKPLAVYDLSIIRKIRSLYHCAVCNETFGPDDDLDHIAAVSHEMNYLSAINKHIELSENMGNTPKANDGCYHFNAKKINDARNDGNRSNDKYFHDNGYNDNYFHDNGSNGSYSREGRYNDNDLYGNRNNDDDSSSIDDYDAEQDSLWGVVDQKPQNGSSYATMLKKPKIIDIPMFLERDLGDKKVKIRFDSYHMLIHPKVNRIYCMVCKDYSHIREKAKHCNDSEHLLKLNQCEVVEGFGDYFIREIDDKLYHCGHCNNLVLKIDMEDHIEERHIQNSHHTIEINKKIIKHKYNYNADDKSDENGNNEVTSVVGDINNGAVSRNDNGEYTYENNSNENSGNDSDSIKNNATSDGPKLLFDKVYINPFGYQISLTLLSYNVVLKRPNFDDYYCGLCNLLCREEAVVQHIQTISHNQSLLRTPFIRPFNCHLIRAVREKLHCAICNIPISVQEIYQHINTKIHIEALNNALKIEPLPTLNVTSNSNPPNNNNAGNGTVENVETLPETKETEETTITKDESLPLNLTKTDATNDTDEMNLLLNDSLESFELDLEDYVYVKYKNTFFKISITSYNTFVHVGEFFRYCFVCSVKVEDINRHVESREHVNNIKDTKFIDKYDTTLLRQIFLMYHCSVCNVLISRRDLEKHLSWKPHLQNTIDSTSATKRMRKNDLKSGKAVHVADCTKEQIYLKLKEPEITVKYKVKFDKLTQTDFVKKKQIVIVKGDVLKVDFDNWHGVHGVDDGYKCQLCQMEVCLDDLGSHVREDFHIRRSMVPCNEEFLEHLLREINDKTLHCIVCNTEVSNKHHIILEHVVGKRHQNAMDAIRLSSSQTDAYTDCEDEPIQL